MFWFHVWKSVLSLAQLPSAFYIRRHCFPPLLLISPLCLLPTSVSHLCKNARNVSQAPSGEGQGVLPAGWGTVTAVCPRMVEIGLCSLRRSGRQKKFCLRPEWLWGQACHSENVHP